MGDYSGHESHVDIGWGPLELGVEFDREAISYVITLLDEAWGLHVECLVGLLVRVCLQYFSIVLSFTLSNVGCVICDEVSF